jgi:hypothetical protein
MDFSIAARGYGIGLAFLTWAIYFSMRRRHGWVGVMLGLGVSANLTIAFPALGLMAAVVLLEDGSWSERFKILATILAPAETLFWLICFAALSSAQRDHYYVGTSTIRESLTQLISSSIRVVHRNGLFGTERAGVLIRTVFLPLVAAFILIASSFDFWRNPENRRRLIAVVTLITTILGVVLAHYLFQLNYPLDRTGLYLLLLFGLAWAIAVHGVRNKWLRGIQLLLACLFMIQFATQVETRYFRAWRFNMDSRTVAQILKKACEGKANNTVAVSTSMIHQAPLEFYRDDLHIAALQPVERIYPTPMSGFDFYVLDASTDADRYQVAHSGLRVLFSDPAAGVFLATQ